MKRAAAALLLLLSFTAYAQTGGVPPSQPPAGEPERFTKPTLRRDPPAAPTTAEAPAKPATKADRRAARKAKREAKVGDKPLD